MGSCAFTNPTTLTVHVGVFVVAAAPADLRSSSFFFQAEDGIRDTSVTGVQTCALPISWSRSAALTSTDSARSTKPGHWRKPARSRRDPEQLGLPLRGVPGPTLLVAMRPPVEFEFIQIGRASCRERV